MSKLIIINGPNLNLLGEREQTQYGSKDYKYCLLYTSPSPRDATLSRMPSSA